MSGRVVWCGRFFSHLGLWAERREVLGMVNELRELLHGNAKPGENIT